MLRKALAGGVESGESFASEDALKPTLEKAVQRFEHYELVMGEDGKPVELGRGGDGGYLQGIRPRYSQITRYGKRCFWSRGGYRLPGWSMGKQGCQRRKNRL